MVNGNSKRDFVVTTSKSQLVLSPKYIHSISTNHTFKFTMLKYVWGVTAQWIQGFLL